MSVSLLELLAGPLSWRRVAPRAKRDFASMLRAQLEAGVQPSLALRQLQGRGRVAQAAQAMADAIESSASFTAAAAGQPALFSAADLALLRIGEETGSLPAVLGAIERSALWVGGLRARTLGALLYPIFLLNLGYLCFSVGLLMSGCVLAYLSGWVELNLWLGGGAAALLLAWRHPVGRKLADAATLAVPGPGWLLRTPVLRYHRAMFFSALGRSLDVGLDLQRGLRLAIETLPNHRVRQDLAQAQAALAGGANLGDAFAPCVTLEPGQRLGIATGEQSGQLPAVLDAQAASERALLEHWTAQYTRLLPVGLLLLTVFGLAARVL